MTALVRVLQELALLAALEQACEALLARCFENYAALAEAAPSGVLEGGQAAPELPAPALLPAVELCNILRDALKPVDQARPAACAAAVSRDYGAGSTWPGGAGCARARAAVGHGAPCATAVLKGFGFLSQKPNPQSTSKHPSMSSPALHVVVCCSMRQCLSQC